MSNDENTTTEQPRAQPMAMRAGGRKKAAPKKAAGRKAAPKKAAGRKAVGRKKTAGRKAAPKKAAGRKTAGCVVASEKHIGRNPDSQPPNHFCNK